MKNTDIIKSLIVWAIMLVLLAPIQIFAHCDGLDGPVVKAAQKALQTGNVNLVLIWVSKKDEVEVEEVFQKALDVRKLSPEARALADRYFFETLVRVHRAGEGAPYTGLKAAGRDLGPAIPAADRALDEGSVRPLLKILMDTSQDSIREYFGHAIARKNFSKDDVEAGRQYVKAYVELIHYVEHLYEAAKNPAHGHFDEVGEGGAQKEEP
jgi:Family of unknown function (DUF6448)